MPLFPDAILVHRLRLDCRRMMLFAGLTAAAIYAQQPPAPKAYRDFAARREGRIERGRELFFSQEKAACASCHTVDGSGSRAGPDLFAIGDKFPRRELADAILEPSAIIAVGYGATFVETKLGETLYGVIKQADAEFTALMGADAKLMRVATQDIKEQRASPISLMSEGLHAALSLQEFADLIEYLASLRQPANSLTSNRGMPDAIEELAKPVMLRPFFDEALRFPGSTVKKPGEIRSGLVWFGQVPDASDAYLVAHQTGKIWRLEKRAADDTKSLFADFGPEIYYQRGPNGLLGLAFHPQFRENRKYYLKHQVLEDGKLATVLVEKRAAADFRTDSGEPSRRLLKILSVTENHSGGCIEFGPDGYLYLGMGDTGPQQDPNGHGQDLQTLLGKMLRIDVDRREGDLPYAIPADNPFRGRSDARAEIWALGFREPWRFSFDPLTRELWVADVGQDRVEEVAIVRRGENHGWNVYEGFEPFSNRRRRDGATYVAPVAAYKRKYGNSVTGGYVYRGNPASSFYGVYVFGDYTSMRIWGLTQENRVLKTIRQIATSPEGIASFATDERGRVFVVGYEGMVYEIDFSVSEFPASTANGHQ
ncbi:MAG: PQQ-dependent sugar dehydrogenase [Opitutaceae bacterium]|nr:PQQ-dependent sugar dehydrogenase [Opitutaceae bacterium]